MRLIDQSFGVTGSVTTFSCRSRAFDLGNDDLGCGLFVSSVRHASAMQRRKGNNLSCSGLRRHDTVNVPTCRNARSLVPRAGSQACFPGTKALVEASFETASVHGRCPGVVRMRRSCSWPFAWNADCQRITEPQFRSVSAAIDDYNRLQLPPLQPCRDDSAFHHYGSI